VNLKADYRHRIRHVEDMLGGPVDERAFALFCIAQDEEEAAHKRVIRERAYEKTGVIGGGE
jgi:hypothetical protein